VVHRPGRIPLDGRGRAAALGAPAGPAADLRPIDLAPGAVRVEQIVTGSSWARAGHNAILTDDVVAVLGRPPTPFAMWWNGIRNLALDVVPIWCHSGSP
jgi:hypothetical protein